MVTFYQDVQAIMIRKKNMASRRRDLFSLYIYLEKNKKSSCHKLLALFQYNFARPLMTLYPHCSSRHDMSKNMAARDRAFMSLYIFIENFNLAGRFPR